MEFITSLFGLNFVRHLSRFTENSIIVVSVLFKTKSNRKTNNLECFKSFRHVIFIGSNTFLMN